MSEHETDRVLVHVCCAICYVGVAQDLAARSIGFGGFFYNPNIQPLIEFRRRMKACQVLAHDTGLPLSVDESCNPAEWLRQVVGREEQRCDVCYRMRLEHSAQAARQGGYASFTTTLLASPHQKHERLRQLGDEIAAESGLGFFYVDWRGTHESARSQARRRNLYRQQYCGCIYSEYERYRDTGEHLWRRPELTHGTKPCDRG